MRPREQRHHRGGAAGGRGDDRPLTGRAAPQTPGPPGAFRLAFDPGARRPRREVLVGGSPVRVLRLSAAGADLVDRWSAGQAVGEGRGARALARRLLDAGLAHPRPPAAAGVSAGVSVVVPVRDDGEGLRETLGALSETAPRAAVVVVDDGSDPPLRTEAAARGSLRVVRTAVAAGPAAARNSGRRVLAGGEIVVFVDAGCIPEPGWLPPLLAHFSDPSVGAAAPRVRSRPAPGTPASLAAYEQLHSPLDLGPREASVRPFGAVPYVPTAALAVRLAAFDSVGGFDEALRFGEDVDLVWRLLLGGWTVRYEPAAGATHPARSSLGAWLRQRYDYGCSATPLARRHGRAVAPLTVSPWSAAAWGLAATGHPLAGAAIAAASTAALARRAGGDRLTGLELARLALAGHARAAVPLAGAVRRAWLPPLTLAAAAAIRGGGRRTRRWLAASVSAAVCGPALADWRRSRPPAAGRLRWVALSLADDLAYQAGVWSGALAGRSAGALLPKW